ncbi:MAG: hypothetical protein AAGA68_14105 [Pseudomonadota bacterium]
MTIKLRNAIGSALAIGLLSAGAQAGDAVYGTANKSDHTNLTATELMRLLPADARRGGTSEIPNRLNNRLERRAPIDLERDPLVDAGVNDLSSPTAGVDFLGPTSDDNSEQLGFRVQPPDTNGDTGLENVVLYINLVWQAYDKMGNPVSPAMPGNTFWAGFGGPCEFNNNGDPVVLYDEEAGRWVFNQFSPNEGIQCFAISDGEDPLGPYTRYEFEVSPNEFNDYPKSGIWRTADGSQSAYTYTGRQFGLPNFNALGIDAVLFDRDAMLAGDPGAGFLRVARVPGGFQTYDGLMPGHMDNDAAPAGACPLFAVAEAPTRYRFYEYCADFANDSGSFRELPSVATDPFDDNLGDVPLPGGDNVDTLAFFTYFSANARNLDAGGHTMALGHSVDVGSDRAGIRWATFDINDYDAISISETGTFAPNDGRERWMGSVTIDDAGNLGLGYTVAGGGTLPDVAYTGREVGDPPGQLQDEVICEPGSGAQTGGGGRWGDYSSTTIDPADGCTFWTFQEYVVQTGSFEWDTRACSFSFDSCTGGGGGDDRQYCITFDNFCDSISVVNGVGQWDYTCDGVTLAEGEQRSLTQAAEAFICTGESCPFGPGAAEDWSFVFRGGLTGGFNLFNLTQGIQFQDNSPYTVFPGQTCPFGARNSKPSILEQGQ